MDTAGSSFHFGMRGNNSRKHLRKKTTYGMALSLHYVLLELILYPKKV